VSCHVEGDVDVGSVTITRRWIKNSAGEGKTAPRVLTNKNPTFACLDGYIVIPLIGMICLDS
jgi:hypothetical protein